ncbi:MAG: family 78 glycoside hydrolase catalytic domain [Armatimonadota bacterium]
MYAAETTNLRCEFQPTPLGIDVLRPRLSWAMENGFGLAPRGLRQTAYQVLVASSPELLALNKGDIWDSGRVSSDQSINVEYSGGALKSGKSYYWKVCVWDNTIKASSWSKPAKWTMGFLKPGDWSAKWISYGSAADWKVLSATFETLDGKISADVTEKLNQLTQTSNERLKVSRDILGDPAYGKLKQLRMTYESKGEKKSVILKEGQDLPFSSSGLGNVSPWFRKEFKLAYKPKSAIITVNSPGYFELYVNGVKAGGDVLTPAVSDLKVQNFSVAYDVAKLLTRGKNCIGIWQGTGWSDSTALRAQLDAIVAGKPLTVGTDSSWLSRPSSIQRIGGRTWNDFGGERFDARMHLPNWNIPGISLQGWKKCVEIARPTAKTMNQPCPTNTIGKAISAVSVIPLGEGRYEIDFGTNLTGWLSMTMPKLPAGHKVTFHFADRAFRNELQPSPIGNISISHGSVVSFPNMVGGKDSFQTYKQTSEFISGGKSGEIFQNKFNYAGFRHVIIEGLPQAPKKEDAVAFLIESDLGSAGLFSCSDELINRIHKINQWTLRCLNLGGYMVDCPTRERMGYGGDGQTSLVGMMMNFNSAGFYEKWVQDWRQAQNPTSGSLANVAPWGGGGGGGPPWPGLTAALPWQHYLHFGSRRTLEENYSTAKRYVEYLDSRSKDEVLRAWGEGFDFLGDWVPPYRGMDSNNWPSKAATELVNNCYRVYLWQLVANMAKGLGRKDEVIHCEDRIAKIRPAVHAAFFDSVNKRYVIDEQVYYVLPLMTRVTPDSERAAVMEKLVQCIKVKSKGHLDTGLIGTTLLMDFLQQEGRDDLLLAMYQKRDYPGWGYMVEQGATTLWEQWNGYWSQIHACFASADNWLYQGLAGIRPDPNHPGFKNVIIKPAVVGNITWADGHHDSPYGRIISRWRRDKQKLRMDVTIPANTTATVYVPAKDVSVVTETGAAIALAKGVKFLGMENGAAVFSVDSGMYRFESMLPESVLAK